MLAKGTPDVAHASVGFARSYEYAEILKLLPHRGCMLLLRRFTVHGPLAYSAEACWSDNDPFVEGHGYSVVPATLLVEAAAQATGAGLMAAGEDADTPQALGVLAGLRRCVFVAQALAGRAVQFEVSARFMTPQVVHANVEVRQGTAKVASLQLLLATPAEGQSAR